MVNSGKIKPLFIQYKKTNVTMTIHLDKELEKLKKLHIEMMELVKAQLDKSKNALLEFNVDLAEEINRNELKVNALELTIEKECENIMALFQPVATDLRLILALLRSVSDLERIGDHADNIAKIIPEKLNPFDHEILKVINAEKMFDFSLDMFDDVIFALSNNDTSKARKLFKKDKELNKIFRNSVQTIESQLTKTANNPADLLALYSILAKLERTGDLLTNVAEEIIFYLDAEVIKHKKKKKQKHDQ